MQNLNSFAHQLHHVVMSAVNPAFLPCYEKKDLLCNVEALHSHVLKTVFPPHNLIFNTLQRGKVKQI